ncbi:MAG: YbaK/EbsC family protein [Lachnospiraceae bacterium]|nr:YbaK/EbsC family protein [Lachnospiraceae bacterium]MBQ8117317.1 YbaK/EbsC family protein [Lachnospiraceae bacterium]
MAIDKVKEYFKGTELEGKVIELAESSATVELAAHALHTEPDRIAKTLSYLVDDDPILVVASGMSRVDNKKYKAQFAKKAKMIPYEEVEDYIGHAPGGVCPFAVREGVKVYLDESLKKYDTVFPAAGSSNSAIEMTMEQLEKFTGYTAWVDVCKEPEE